MDDTRIELRNLSRQLNMKSRKVDAIISTANRKLAALGLEMDVWLDDKAVAYGYYGEENDQSHCSRRALLLGWSVFDESWQLAVRLATIRVRTNQQGHEFEEVVNPEGPTPLAMHDRWIGMRAVRVLPSLLTLLEKEVKSVIGDIGQAEEVVEAL